MEFICGNCLGGRVKPTLKCGCECADCSGRGEKLVTCPVCRGAERVWFGLRKCPTHNVHSAGRIPVRCPSCEGRKDNPNCSYCKGGTVCCSCKGQGVFQLEKILPTLSLSNNEFYLEWFEPDEYTVSLPHKEPLTTLTLSEVLPLAKDNCSWVEYCYEHAGLISLSPEDKGRARSVWVARVGENQYVMGSTDYNFKYEGIDWGRESKRKAG